MVTLGQGRDDDRCSSGNGRELMRWKIFSTNSKARFSDYVCKNAVSLVIGSLLLTYMHPNPIGDRFPRSLMES